METKNCFKQSCKHEAEYVCKSNTPESYLCKRHFEEYASSNRDHNFEPLYLQPAEGTREAIINILEKTKHKQES
ncbi:unnamed protein product [Blepharisma stoltei]|uniref:Uncharacterized protein n=1 Tax=Blepharisma stoltei TaxID=1481888 RepID=A0AAU9JPX2_9CILI|nr:unnamed protein product [Blepharisma stoltei]